MCIRDRDVTMQKTEKASSKKYVFPFEEGDGKNKQLLGGKGSNLCEMTQIGLNVPPGFVISTEACLDFLESEDHSLLSGLMEDIKNQIHLLEKKSGKIFGDDVNPLLVSVRSGSAMSMPGMMDTILNLGLNNKTLAGLINQTGNERFCYDAYRRFIQLFGKVALGVPEEKFDLEFEAVKLQAGVKVDIGLNANNLQEISNRFLKVVHTHTGREFPENVFEQLEIAVKAVFNSWMGKRAIDYRREFKITPEMANGTAVNVMAMVFGNMGNDCATGVGFTRDPGTGENVMFGEYLVNAQGEDVVAGIRTPKAVALLEQEMPVQYKQLEELRQKLENHYKDCLLYTSDAADERSSVDLGGRRIIKKKKRKKQKKIKKKTRNKKKKKHDSILTQEQSDDSQLRIIIEESTQKREQKTELRKT